MREVVNNGQRTTGNETRRKRRSLGGAVCSQAGAWERGKEKKEAEPRGSAFPGLSLGGMRDGGPALRVASRLTDTPLLEFGFDVYWLDVGGWAPDYAVHLFADEVVEVFERFADFGLFFVRHGGG
jgi:hypothetical protein